MPNKFCISRHVVFFENQILFSTHVESLPYMFTLPNFDELNPTPQRFKPEFMHEQRRLTLSLP